MRRTCHVVEISARTPLGLVAATSAGAVRAGIVRIQEHETLMDPAGEPLRIAMDGALDPKIMGWERMAALLLDPLGRIIRSLPPRGPRDPIQVLLALPEHRPGFEESHERRLLQQIARLEFSDRPFGVQTVARGHAAGLLGLHRAVEMIGEGSAELVVVGGVDSYLDADTIDWLGKGRRLATRHTRSSFFPGEGAGFVAIMSDSRRRSLGLSSLAVIGGTGIAREPSASEDPASDPVNLGRGLSAAISAATLFLRERGRKVERVLCDLNGERSRSEEWGMVALQTHEAFAQAGDFEAPAGQWGDVGAASGTLLTTLVTEAWQRGYDKGSTTLLFAGSDSGLRAATVFQRPAG